MSEDQLYDAAEREMDLYRNEITRITAERDELRAKVAAARSALQAAERVAGHHERALYAAWIDVRHGDPGDAVEILAEQLDGYDGPQWNGRETGIEWLERTREAAAITCDVCGLPDPYNGGGDGIGSCECPRCDGGEAAASSVLCICPPDDIDGYDGGEDEYRQSTTACCPRETIPDSCSCPDGCECLCADCDCPVGEEED